MQGVYLKAIEWNIALRILPWASISESHFSQSVSQSVTVSLQIHSPKIKSECAVQYLYIKTETYN